MFYIVISNAVPNLFELAFFNASSKISALVMSVTVSGLSTKNCSVSMFNMVRQKTGTLCVNSQCACHGHVENNLGLQFPAATAHSY